MKKKLKTLRLHMLLPVVALTLFTVIILTGNIGHAYIHAILRFEPFTVRKIDSQL